MKLKKIICLMSALAIFAGVISGCGAKKDESEESIVLKYIMVGPAGQEDQQMVFAEFNNKLQEKLPNVTVDFEIIASADYKQRFMLMQAGGEKVDIVGTYCIDFTHEVSNNTFIALDDLIDEYAKETKEALPEWLFDYMTVDGKIYGIPAYQQLDTPYGLFMPKKLTEKYLDVEAFKTALQAQDFTTVYDMIEDYAAKLQANGELGLGLDVDMIAYANHEQIKSGFAVKRFGDDRHTVEYSFMDDVYQEYFARVNEWNKKGYIRKDAMTASDKEQKRFLEEGGYVMFSSQIKPIDPTDEKLQKFDMIPFFDHYTIPSSSAAGGVAITASCEHPEAAMKLLNLLHTDKELFNLLSYGIEGKHYKKIDENKIEVPYKSVQGSTNDKYGLFRWIIGNTEISYDTQYDTEIFKNWVFNEVNKAEEKSEFIGFTLNTTDIQTQIDQIAAIKDQYHNTLLYGVADDWKVAFDEWQTKIKAAGLDEVKAEIQRQVDEFLASK